MSVASAPHAPPDQAPDNAQMLADVVAGLARQPRRQSAKYFYDARGSRLFEEICRQPEYYLTNAELALMECHVKAMAATLGPAVKLVEYGTGSGIKTRMLIEQLADPVAYVPVEISASALRESVAHLAATFPDLEMLPVVADFTQPVQLPQPRRRTRRTVIYFPGSTLGNFEPAVAERLLRSMHRTMGADGAALIGVDRVKEPAIIEAAYNDAAGVTAEFTLNMLARFNRELDADFDLGGFRHRSVYNRQAARVETFIVSTRAQDVHVGGHSFHFAPDEAMLVELSCKYTRASFAQLAAGAGLAVRDEWHDPRALFSVFLLARSDATA